MEKSDFLVIGLLFGAVIGLGAFLGVFSTVRDEVPSTTIPLTVQEASSYLSLFNEKVIANLSSNQKRFRLKITIDEIDVQHWETHADGGTNITFYFSSTDPQRTNKGSYKWKINYTYWINGTKYNELVQQNLNKNHLDKNYTFFFEDAIEQFYITVGETSTEIDGTGATEATIETGNENICRNGDYELYTAYEGGAADLWFGNSSDNGTTWSIQEVSAGNYFSVGIVCLGDDDVLVYGVNGDLGPDGLQGFNSTNGGSTWSGSYLLASDPSFQNYYSGSCEMDGNGCVHCVAPTSDSSEELHYVNCTSWNSETIISEGGSVGDPETCDIFIDKDNVPVVTCMAGGNRDALWLLSPAVNRWSDGNEIYIRDGTAWTAADSGPDITGAIVDDEMQLHVCNIMEDDLWYHNSTSNNYDAWTSTQLETSATADCSIVVDDLGRVEILAWDRTSTIYRWNNTVSDPLTFTKSTVQSAGGAFDPESPSMGHTLWPLANRINSSSPYFYYVFIDQSGPDFFFDNYTITGYAPGGGGGDTCDYSSGNFIIDCSESCTVDSASNVGGNNVIASGSGKITQSASITNWAEFEIKGGV